MRWTIAFACCWAVASGCQAPTWSPPCPQWPEPAIEELVGYRRAMEAAGVPRGATPMVEAILRDARHCAALVD